MKTTTAIAPILLSFVAAILSGCGTSTTKSPDVADSIRHSLESSGLKDVSVSQDRDKGVVTLGGHVAADGDKSKAESLAASLAAGQVVANQIAVIPAGVESDAKAVNSDIDQGIEKNLDAALITARLKDQVKFSVKNGVVTLTGSVIAEDVRSRVAGLATGVPNVQQVVNEIQVKNQKATSN